MADEPVKTPDPGVSNDDPKTDENQFTIDRAEYERLQARDALLKEIDEWATEAGIEGGGKAYVEALESIANENYNAPSEPETPPVKSDEPKTPPVATPPPAGLSAEDRKALEESKRQAAAAFLSAQATEWKSIQDSLPEDERSPASRRELDELIQRRPHAVKDLSADRAYGGNVYAAANALFLTTSDGIRKTREAAAAAQKAKDDAASAASLSPGGKTATPSTQTEEDKMRAQMKAEADKIAPDDPPYEPPL